jgi:hypothetical protein
MRKKESLEEVLGKENHGHACSLLQGVKQMPVVLGAARAPNLRIKMMLSVVAEWSGENQSGFFRIPLSYKVR